jgi:nucleoside-diphosphate-sugar epimerase
MNKKTVLITGAGGFLGSHLCERFLSEGYRVIGADNFSTGFRSNLTFLQALPAAKERLTFIEADVVQPWSTWLKDVDLGELTHVFHFASPASPPLYQVLNLETMWVNSIGLANAMEFADRHKARVIFASTSEIYGDPEFSPQPETYWGNVNTVGVRSCYDEAKRFGEALLFTHNWRHSTRHGMVRIFNTYGPRMNPADGRVIINFLVQALKGEELTVYGTGSQTRSFCFVDDLINGIVAYSRTNLTDPVNIGNEGEFTILELAEKVRDLFPEKKLKIAYRDLPKDDPKQRRPDLTRARALLQPWEPKVKLEDGLKRMVAWLTSLPEFR